MFRRPAKIYQTMLLHPAMPAYLQPKLLCSSKESISLKPCIKMSKENFQVCVDVQLFNKDEIRVRAHPEYLIIEGKQEKNTPQGYALRQFIRKFKLPGGCETKKIKCTLTSEGILTVDAKRSLNDSSTPAEVVMVPIAFGPSATAKNNEFMIGPPPEESQVYVNPCANYPKVKVKFEPEEK